MVAEFLPSVNDGSNSTGKAFLQQQQRVFLRRQRQLLPPGISPFLLLPPPSSLLPLSRLLQCSYVHHSPPMFIVARRNPHMVSPQPPVSPLFPNHSSLFPLPSSACLCPPQSEAFSSLFPSLQPSYGVTASPRFPPLPQLLFSLPSSVLLCSLFTPSTAALLCSPQPSTAVHSLLFPLPSSFFPLPQPSYVHRSPRMVSSQPAVTPPPPPLSQSLFSLPSSPLPRSPLPSYHPMFLALPFVSKLQILELFL
ncbi:hypothetical protein BHM03_00009160 [Ensete ventricosum]|nr:hypothetical protein BHM03_00009160 [Ensete ventricosum]